MSKQFVNAKFSEIIGVLVTVFYAKDGGFKSIAYNEHTGGYAQARRQGAAFLDYAKRTPPAEIITEYAQTGQYIMAMEWNLGNGEKMLVRIVWDK